MKNKVLIQMTFDTGRFMTFDFVFKLLYELNLLRGGIVELNYIESLEYSEEELYEKLHNLNCKIHRFALITSNDEISFSISNPSVITFSQLRITCNKNDEEINLYLNILFKYFKDNFYMIHVFDIKDYNKSVLSEKRLNFLKNKKYLILSKLYPLSLYEEIGYNIGMSLNMYFGRNMYDLINKEILLKCPQVFKIEELNNVINIQLYESINNKRNLKTERQVRNYLHVDEIALFLKKQIYMDDRYGQLFLKGHEKYQSYYFYEKYINTSTENKYIFPICNYDLILRKYKNTVFERIDEDFNSGEIIGFLMYKREDEAVALKELKDLEAYIYIELFDISSKVDEYAKDYDYTVSNVSENRYLFEKEDNIILDKFNYFVVDNNEHNYKIHLIVHKKLLDNSDVKKITMEYDKMINSSRLKQV